MENFNIIERGFEFYGRKWEKIDKYELNLCSRENPDGDDWLLLDFNGAVMYENNYWGGIILFDADGEIFVSYL